MQPHRIFSRTFVGPSDPDLARDTRKLPRPSPPPSSSSGGDSDDSQSVARDPWFVPIRKKKTKQRNVPSQPEQVDDPMSDGEEELVEYLDQELPGYPDGGSTAGNSENEESQDDQDQSAGLSDSDTHMVTATEHSSLSETSYVTAEESMRSNATRALSRLQLNEQSPYFKSTRRASGVKSRSIAEDDRSRSGRV